MKHSNDGLPPSGPQNKVSNRSKTASFKRPISCEFSSLPKKESRGIFNILRKGSSNTKLNEEAPEKESMSITNSSTDIKYNNYAPIKIPTMHFRGRDSDDDDDDNFPMEDTSVIKLTKKFENERKVMSDPALVAASLKYLYDHNKDYSSFLFYLVVQLYKLQSNSKEFLKEAQKYANEVFTTFLHNKAILKIEHSINSDQILDNLTSNTNMPNIFEFLSNEVYEHCIKQSISQVRQSITHGLFSDDFIFTTSFEKKLAHLNEVIKHIVISLESKIPKESSQHPTQETIGMQQNLNDLLLAVKTSLASIYFYFSKLDKDENSDTISINSKSVRSNLLARSVESLQTASSWYLEKHPLFCSKHNRKTGAHSFFKKGKTFKGHSFSEKNYEFPADCSHCYRLIWGLSPQGLFCSHCQKSVHKQCKDQVRTSCQKPDNRKFQRNPSSTVEDIKTGIYDTVSVSSLDPNADSNKDSIHSAEIESHVDAFDIKDGDINNDLTTNDKNCNIVINSDDVGETETECSDTIPDSTEISRNESYVRSLTSMYNEKSIPRSQSEESVESKSMFQKRVSQSVNVQNLVCEWPDDPDMNVHDTFEADVELKEFPNHLTKEEDKAEYTRLLVLMEFYHKIRFTVMTLKRFDYHLIRKWPVIDDYLYKSLSLDCIIPLYELIKKLVNTIETCKEDCSFSTNTAKIIVEWLKENDEENLQEWLRLSINLCCTNSLHSVKMLWRDIKKTDSRYTAILSWRHNKMIVVEQLSNMRPLLFNLPLIINKVIRDLSKYPKFREESKLWKVIHEKFKLLPSYIDERCMPLVELINNGTIVNSLERSVWASRLSSNDQFYDYIIDFPKTAFHHKFFDFQDIQISNFRESGNKEKTPAVFVKDISDAYAICYDNMLVLLQKENEKYILKQFKATDTSKLNPIIAFENVHASQSNLKDKKYELTLVFIRMAILTQLIFKTEETITKWLSFIQKIKYKKIQNRSSSSSHSAIDVKAKDSEKEPEDINNEHNATNFQTNDLDLSDIRLKETKLKVFTKHEKNISEFINDMKEILGNDTYANPINSNQCVFGTICDTIDVLNDSMTTLESSQMSEEITNRILSNVDRMKNRINFYKNHSDSTKEDTEVNEINLDFNNNADEMLISDVGSLYSIEKQDAVSLLSDVICYKSNENLETDMDPVCLDSNEKNQPSNLESDNTLKLSTSISISIIDEIIDQMFSSTNLNNDEVIDIEQLSSIEIIMP